MIKLSGVFMCLMFPRMAFPGGKFSISHVRIGMINFAAVFAADSAYIFFTFFLFKMEPGVDYGSNHYPLEGSEDVAPRNQPLREQEQSLQDVVVDVEGLEPEEPETTRPSSSRFCPGCGFKAGGMYYCI